MPWRGTPSRGAAHPKLAIPDVCGPTNAPAGVHQVERVTDGQDVCHDVTVTTVRSLALIIE